MSPRRSQSPDARWGLLALLATAACGPSHSGADGDAATLGAADAGPPARCTLRDAPGLRDPSALVESVTRGPHGTRLFTNVGWADADGRGDFALPPGGSVAWNGVDFVVASPRGVDAYDAQLAPRRAHHALGGRVCYVRALESGAVGDVALVYQRLTHGDACETGSGGIFFQRLGPQGALLGAPVAVGRLPAGRDRLRDPSARVDAGRVVVEFTDANEPDDPTRRYAVLGLDGRDLSVGDGVNVACPRAGCVRVLGRADPGAHAFPDALEDRMRVAQLGRATAFNLDAQVDHVVGLAVFGDRVLVSYHAVAASPDDTAAWSLAVVDVTRRAFEPVADSTEHDVVRSWHGGSGPAQVWSTPTGFVVASVGNAAPTTRLVECQR